MNKLLVIAMIAGCVEGGAVIESDAVDSAERVYPLPVVTATPVDASEGPRDACVVDCTAVIASLNPRDDLGSCTIELHADMHVASGGTVTQISPGMYSASDLFQPMNSVPRDVGVAVYSDKTCACWYQKCAAPPMP